MPVIEAFYEDELGVDHVVKAVWLREEACRSEEETRDAVEASIHASLGEDGVDLWTNGDSGPGRRFRRVC